MKLRHREFERAVRDRVRAAVRQSPALRREYRRVRRGGRTDVSQGLFRGLLSFLLAMALMKLGGQGGTADAMLGLLTIWCASFAVHYANRLRFELYGSPQLVVLALQPMRDADIFTHQWRGFSRLTLWTLADITAALAVVFWFAGATPLQWITALPCTLALWMSVVSVATVFVRIRPGANFGGLSSGLFLLVVATVIAAFYAPATVARLLDGASGPFYAIPPFGWIGYVVHESVLGPALLPLLLLVPVALLAPGLHHARRRLAANYQLFASDEPVSEDSSEPADPHALPAAPRETEPAGPPSRPDREQVRYITEAWHDDRALWPNAGFLECWTRRWLTPRERDLAEFMTAGHAEWTLSLRRAYVLALAAMFAAFTLGPTGLWLSYVGLYFAATNGVPVLGTPCVGLAIVTMAGATLPAYAGLPIGFHELARVLLKVGIVRTLAFAPGALLAGAVIGFHGSAGAMPGLIIAAKAISVLLAWQPALVALQFSAGTNDTRGPAWRSLKLFAAIGPLILSTVGASTAAFFTPAPWAVACLAIATTLSWATLQLYGRFYNRNRFDLMHGQAQ